MVLAVAAGGALGAVGRYLAMSWIGHRWSSEFPYGTLSVNVCGSFLLGILSATAAFGAGPILAPVLMVGALGAFTTFSTFALDIVYLVERKAYGRMAAYLALSIALSIAGLLVGVEIGRATLA